MNQLTRPPQHPSTARPQLPPVTTRLDSALLGLSSAITELIRLSSQDRQLVTRRIEVLRTRRHQLSAVIDGLIRFAGPDP